MRVSSVLEAFSGRRVLVVGDLMVDQIWNSDYVRPYPDAEAPIIALRRSWMYPGGAANVAMNALYLGAEVTVLGAVGSDHLGDWLRSTLIKKGVRFPNLRLPGIRNTENTTNKIRVYQDQKMAFRVDHDQVIELPTNIALEAMGEWGPYDVLLLSDYQKGAFWQGVDPYVDAFRRMSPEGIIAINPRPVMIGGLPKGLDLVQLNTDEVTWACLEHRLQTAKNISEKIESAYFLETLGSGGLSLHHQGRQYSQAREGVTALDPCGAGDATFAAAALTLSITPDPRMIAKIANAAGAIQTSKRGTQAVRAAEVELLLGAGSGEVMPVTQVTRVLDTGTSTTGQK